MEGVHGLVLAAEDRETDLPDHRVVPLDQGCEGEPCGVAAASRSASSSCLSVSPVAVPASNSTPRAAGRFDSDAGPLARPPLVREILAPMTQPPGSDLFRDCTGIRLLGRGREAAVSTGATGAFPSRLSTLADGT